jgi:uncharacterized protein (DUF342 family)
VASITITRSADGLIAFCKVTDAPAAGAYPTALELLNTIKGSKIVYGVDEAAVRQMATEKIYNIPREIARGLPPQKSVDASLDMLIDITEQGKPRMLPDGRVDFHDLQTVINVRKGTPLIRRQPGVPGKDGLTVLGTPYKCAPPRECRLISGKGTVIEPANPDLLVAAIDGALAITPDGFVEVRTEKSIPGDIDFSTGDIAFSGDLKIGGSVRAGFKVSAEGNIQINGGVEDAEVTSGGTLVIHGGAVGSSNGKLRSQGSIKVRHIENFSAEARHDIIIAEDAMHATLSAGGNITVKSILGEIGRAACRDRV